MLCALRIPRCQLPGELTDIILNGGVVNPNYLKYPNYGYSPTPPTRDGIKYSIFLLYDDKVTLPLKNYDVR